MKQNKTWGFTGIEILIVLAVAAILGTGTTVVADQSKPGDLLFPVDTAFEEIRVAITPNLEAKANLRVKYAKERVQEVDALLKEKGADAPGVKIALDNIAKQKKQAADALTQAKAQGKVIIQKAREVKSAFDQQEKVLGASFQAVRVPLRTQKKKLQNQLKQALKVGDAALAAQIKTQIAAVDNALDALEQQKDGAGQALDLQGKRLEEELSAQEKARSKAKDAAEKAKDAAGKAKEQAQDASEKLEEAKIEAEKQVNEKTKENLEKAENEAKRSAEKVKEVEKDVQETEKTVQEVKEVKETKETKEKGEVKTEPSKVSESTELPQKNGESVKIETD